jgi:hypothetical protein
MEEYITQEQWQDEIGMIQEWVEPTCSLPMIEYKVEQDKLHHQHMQLEDLSAILVQYTHTYKIIKTVIINVPLSEIPTVMDGKYWLGAPQVQPMLPGTTLGYFRISGVYMLEPEV